MAPPRTVAGPLLADLDPHEVATEVCRRVVDHMHSLAIALQPRVDHLRLADPAELATGSDLGLTVQALTTYAQRGLPVWDWTTSGMASDGCLSVFAALYTSAGDRSVGGGITNHADEVEAADAIGVVLLAAYARIRIAQGTPVSHRELAVLSGLSRRQVQHLAKAGELTTCSPGHVAAAEAHRWLTARGVRVDVRHR